MKSNKIDEIIKIAEDYTSKILNTAQQMSGKGYKQTSNGGK